MQPSERIHIQPKRGHLPRRYEVIDQRTPKAKSREVFWLCLTCAAITGTLWWVLT
jgi:hypothetical protein